ncbi:MAG: beta galactosidase jelly roll domain-containing protein [Bacteroidales bacterium]|nr:beta galactosidase jelly roll domain-containing protein [Bacteroidales bacterium]
MRSFKIVFISILFISLSFQTEAQMRLPAIIGDNMVLQQQSKAPLWGWTAPGEEIRVSVDWSNEAYFAKADENGRWQVDVVTPDAGGPYAIVIQGKEKITLSNVMIGEVWLCSGQSNMEMPLEGWPNQPITGSEKYISEADHPDIRLFTVKRKTSYEPLEDCEGQWAPCSPDNVGSFSATGFFFGLHLYKKLNIPIGLINSTWGGTPAEAWTSNQFIDRIPYFHTSAGSCDPELFRDNKFKAQESVQKAWLDDLGFVPGESSPDWTLAGYDDSGWDKLTVPANWSETVVGHFEGLMELRLEVRVPRFWTNKTTILDLGPIDEMDITWINGQQVGEHLNVSSWSTFRSYEIPPGILKPGKNLIAVQVANTSGQGGINGGAGEMKLYPKDSKFFKASLSGKWKYRKGLGLTGVKAMPYCPNCGEAQTPTTLYNGMIAPLIPFRIKGAIWYQGESNRYDGKLYADIFPNMIENWRSDWEQGDFPFYFVQIAPYTYRDDFSTGLLREAQLQSLKTPKTGMVVTMDIGSLKTIHPPDKNTVGQRLATWALVKDYRFSNIYYSGPLYKTWRNEGDKIRVFFDYTCGGLKAEGGELRHFMIAGPDMKFVPAKAVIDKNTVLVFSKEVKNPVAVRFGWGHTDQTNLFNSARLPASPFRTDDL